MEYIDTKPYVFCSRAPLTPSPLGTVSSEAPSVGESPHHQESIVGSEYEFLLDDASEILELLSGDTLLSDDTDSEGTTVNASGSDEGTAELPHDTASLETATIPELVDFLLRANGIAVRKNDNQVNNVVCGVIMMHPKKLDYPDLLAHHTGAKDGLADFASGNKVTRKLVWMVMSPKSRPGGRVTSSPKIPEGPQLHFAYPDESVKLDPASAKIVSVGGRLRKLSVMPSITVQSGTCPQHGLRIKRFGCFEAGKDARVQMGRDHALIATIAEDEFRRWHLSGGKAAELVSEDFASLNYLSAPSLQECYAPLVVPTPTCVTVEGGARRSRRRSAASGEEYDPHSKHQKRSFVDPLPHQCAGTGASKETHQRPWANAIVSILSRCFPGVKAHDDVNAHTEVCSSGPVRNEAGENFYQAADLDVESDIEATLKRLSTLVRLKRKLSGANLMAAEKKLVEFKECIFAGRSSNQVKCRVADPTPPWELYVKLTDADVTARLKRVEKRLKCRPNISATDRHKYEKERSELIRRLKYAKKRSSSAVTVESQEF